MSFLSKLRDTFRGREDTVRRDETPDAPVLTSLSLMDKYRLYRLTQDKTMIEKLKSRKLWAAVVAGAIVTIGTQLGMSQDLVNTLSQLAMTYILGQAVVDTAAALKSK